MQRGSRIGRGTWWHARHADAGGRSQRLLKEIRMGWFVNRGVRTKLMLSFGLVCVLMLFVGGLGLKTVAGIREDEENIAGNSLPSTVALGRANAALVWAQRDVR